MKEIEMIVIEDLRPILFEVFPGITIPTDISTLKMGDIDPWDSLGNFNLLLAIEEHFDIHFAMEDLTEIKSLAQIIEVLKARNA